MTTGNPGDRFEDGREKPFDPFAEEGESPFVDDRGRHDGEPQDHSWQDAGLPPPASLSADEGVGQQPHPHAGHDPVEGMELPPQPEPVDASGFERPAQLELGDEEQRLPWLEGDADEDEYAGYGGGQIAMIVLAALGVLALVVGGIWWATRTGPDEALVADGGVIEAPDTPYKVKPQDPGVDPVRGTGDTAFAVAEGESRQVQVDEGDAAPKPGFAPGVTGAPAPSASPASKAPAGKGPTVAAEPSAAPVASGPGVQVGAYSSREAAEKGWQALSGQYAALKGMKYRVVEGQADIGKVFRLQAMPGNAAAAQSLCQGLRTARLSCQVKN